MRVIPPTLLPQASPAHGWRLGATQCSSRRPDKTEKDGPQWPTDYSAQGLSALLLGRSPPLVRCCSFWQYSRPLCRVLRSIERQMRRSLAEVEGLRERPRGANRGACEQHATTPD